MRQLPGVNKAGATAVYVAIMIIVFIGIAALAVDVAHLVVVRNQLQNAADAGALAGANTLYLVNATEVNTGANDTADDVATSNNADTYPVEVNSPDSNLDGVQRGHWSFATHTFTQSDVTTIPDALNATDSNLDYVNAVRVIAQRGPAIPAASFFARIFNYFGFNMSASAVAYDGFGGTILPGQATAPFALCSSSITDPDTGKYSCEKGRFINSGGSSTTNQTGYWTNEYNSTDSSCSGLPPSSASSVGSLITFPSNNSCSAANTQVIYNQNWLVTNNGQMDTVYRNFWQCWVDSAGVNGQMPIVPWPITVPVIDCTTQTCNQMVGVVDVNVLWVTDQNDPHYNNVPTQMASGTSSNSPIWKCPSYCSDATYLASNNFSYQGQCCWYDKQNGFDTYFNLQNPDGTPATYQNDSIYLQPDCSQHDPKGETGGGPFGVTAGIPVLVK